MTRCSRNGHLAIVPAQNEKSEEAEFIMLKDGRIYFQGYVAELRASTDPYLKAFLSGWVPPLFR